MARIVWKSSPGEGMTVENKQMNQVFGLQLYFYIMGGWLMLYDHLAVESLVKV